MRSKVIDINRSGFFSLEEATVLVPTLKAITEKYVEDIEKKMTQLESLSSDKNELIGQLEDEINSGIHSWHNKIRKLGGEPKGLWLVDLDSGHGYFCWKYPESKLEYWHPYSSGFKNRISISEMPPLAEVQLKKPVPDKENVVSTLL